MEQEVSSISKLGIVLISLAVLIALGFGIFQISKSVANQGVGDVQQELDGVSTSKFSSYDQKIITGTMAITAIQSFEGESAAVLIANQAWKNVLDDANASVGDYSIITKTGTGFTNYYSDDKVQLPIVWAYTDNEFKKPYDMISNDGNKVNGSFINYNAIIGASGNTPPIGTVNQTCKINGNSIYMAGIYFDNTCWRCTSGFASDESGKGLYNGITGNLSKTGRTEYIPSSAKFDSYILKDASGSYMGIVLEQINNG